MPHSAEYREIIPDRLRLMVWERKKSPSPALKSERHLAWDSQESQPPVSARSSLRNSQVCNQYKIDSSPAGRERQRQIHWRPGIVADTPLDPVLIKASFAEQPGPPWEQPSPEEAATNCGSPVVSKRWPRAKRGLHLSLAYTRLSLQLRHQSRIQRGKPEARSKLC